MEKTYKGSCFCGAVSLVVTGEPVTMGYCHCESCRHWSAGPVNAYTLWRPGAVKITAGAENIGSYGKTPNSLRKWCKTCGGHLLTEHPSIRLVDVYAAVLPALEFRPREHLHYQEAVDVEVPLTMAVRTEVPRHAVHVSREVGAVIQVETA
jgi:hypothetical protein